ncbi:MAG: septal ring lytic transglycosylase RlpA family protein [Magnetococcales bacterium]|nr:septal ring lytic transglycosylase RlpA family protein [Magnetococcales bacterium]
MRVSPRDGGPWRRLLLSLPLLFLAGCTGFLASPPTEPEVPQVTPPQAKKPSRLPPTSRPYTVFGVTYTPLLSSEGYVARGVASWYGPQFHGRDTSNGERFDMEAISAAHTTLPLPTNVLVTNLENGRKLEVRVNDRGPFVNNRLIDLSRAAARALGFLERGTADVMVEALGPAPELTLEAKAAARGVGGAGEESSAGDGEGGRFVPALQRARVDPKFWGGEGRPPPSGPAAVDSGKGKPPGKAVPGKAVPGKAQGWAAREGGAGKSSQAVYLQVGAFRVPGLANGLVGRLQEFGEVQIQKSRVNGETFYRVRMGPYATQKQADAVVKRLARSGYVGARLVTE